MSCEREFEKFTVASGEITRAEADFGWTYGSVAGSATWSGCAVAGCRLLPFVTIGPGSEPSDCSAEDRHWPHSDIQITVAWSGGEYFGGNSSAFDVQEVPLSGGPGQLACLSLLETYEKRPKCDFEPGVVCPQYIVTEENYSVLASKPLSSSPLITIIDADLAVTKEGSGTGTVTSEPAGINCGVDCKERYAEGTSVTLTASAGPGSEFSGWKGCGSEVGGKCVVTLSDAKVVKAKFNEAKTLSVQKEGAGLGSVKSSPAGISCMTTCDSARMRSPGGAVKEVTLTASPYKGSTFVGWGGDCSGKAVTCAVTLSATESVTAEFAPIQKVGLTLNKVSGAGTVKSSPASINCAAACSTQTSSFYESSEVTLTATPYKSTFVQWTGACSGSSPTCKVTMSEAQAVGAEFTGTTLGTVSLTLEKAAGSTGTGKVQVYAGRINCDANCTASTAVLKPGAKVVLKQTPSKGSTFVRWGGACSGSGACEVTLSEAKEVTAEFKAIPANSLTLNKAGGGRGMVKSKPAGVNCGLTCSQAVALFPQAAGVILTAVPGQGLGPVQWTGCNEVSGELCVVTMSSAKEVTAKFE